MEPLPNDVVKFIDENIESIDHLEILRILSEDRERDWDQETLARQVQTKVEVIRTVAAALNARGLLVTTTRSAEISCRYGPRTPELEALISRLLQVYKERPVTMIKTVYERAKDPLRAFADAFRIRKEE